MPLRNVLPADQIPELPEGTRRYKSFYAVYPDGRVLSMLRRKYKFLSQNVSADGYHSVEIRNRTGAIKRERVNRIVCCAWNGEPPFDGAVCRHKDGTRNNNHYENLEWGSHSDNALDMRRHGTSHAARNGKVGALKISGSRCHLAKLDEDKVRIIRQRLANGEMGKVIAKDFGVTPTAISRINKGRGWATA